MERPRRVSHALTASLLYALLAGLWLIAGEYLFAAAPGYRIEPWIRLAGDGLFVAAGAIFVYLALVLRPGPAAAAVAAPPPSRRAAYAAAVALTFVAYVADRALRAGFPEAPVFVVFVVPVTVAAVMGGAGPGLLALVLAAAVDSAGQALAGTGPHWATAHGRVEMAAMAAQCAIVCLLGEARLRAARRGAERAAKLAESERIRRDSQERLRFWSEPFERAGIGCIVSDPRRGTIVAVNPAFARDRGYALDELVGRPLAGLFPEDRLPDLKRIAAELDREAHGVFETEHLRKDGSRFPVLLDITVLRDAAGRPEHRIGYAVDLTERRRAERELALAREERLERERAAAASIRESLDQAVAARAKAEDLLAALQDSEGRLALFIEHAPAALAMFDAGMRYLAASRRWREDYGLPDAIIGLSHYELFPEIGADWREAHRRGLAGEVVRRDEDRFHRPDGTAQWIRWELRPWRRGDDSVGGIVIFTEDITRYKLAIGRQTRLAGLLRALSDVNRLITTVKDKDALLRQACAVLTQTRGYRSAWIGLAGPNGALIAAAESKLSGRFGALASAMAAGYRPACCAAAAAAGEVVVVRGGDAVCAACPLGGMPENTAALIGPLAHAGAEYGALVVALPAALADDAEERSLFREVADDLAFALHDLDTESGRARADRELRSSERRFAVAFAASPVGIAISVVESGRILDANAAFLDLFGYARAEAVGRAVEELGLWEAGVRPRLIEALLERGRLKDYELAACRKDGGRRDVLAAFELVELGGELCTLAILTDVTERKRAEESVKRSLREKETLLRELYHRTKNNMMTIVALMAIRAEEHRGAPLDEFVEAVSQKIRAMALVHEKLYEREDLSRIDLGDYLRELARLAVEGAGAAERISLEIDAEPASILFDTAVPIGLAVSEFLSNSLRHAFPDGRSGAIRLSLARAGAGRLRLDYADDGVGLPPGFDPAGPGALGLRTAVELVAGQLRGTVAVLPGPGAAFQVDFRDDLYTARV